MEFPFSLNDWTMDIKYKGKTQTKGHGNRMCKKNPVVTFNKSSNVSKLFCRFDGKQGKLRVLTFH